MSLPQSHDPLDELLAAALHGELSPAERVQLESLLQNDPAARAAYLETQTMHDLLEKTHRDAQPDSAFESRMVSGVRRKIKNEATRETAWESLLFYWKWAKAHLAPKRRWSQIGLAGLAVLAVLGVVLRPITSSPEMAKEAYLERHLKLGDAEVKSVPSQAPVGLAIDGAVASVPPAATADLQQPIINRLPGNAPPSSPPTPMLATTKPTRTLANSISSSDKVRVDMPDANGIEDSGAAQVKPVSSPSQINATALPTPTEPTQKLIRNAQLDLEVKSFQAAMDRITAMTQAASGYIDSSNSQKGGNGKLQGTVVVKILPQNLDAFLLKLRDVGAVENQSVGTENVTKQYYDTQARLDNARRMETQLQELLAHENSKVSDLLAVERELGRVRGEIEEMQGQLKLYDFEVQYATVTIQLREKDLNQTAAYLLKEQDDFSLFAKDVEATFRKARSVADSLQAQVLQANLNHNSGSDVTAELLVMVAPDRLESFLAQVRALGRVDNFTRQTQRVAKDGGDTDQPADETRTDKDNVQVHVTIRSDDETPTQQTEMSVLVNDVENQAQAIKKQAADGGIEVKESSFDRQPDGHETAHLRLRLPLSKYPAFVENLQRLGKVESLTVQRQDRPDSSGTPDDAPVEIALEIHNQGDVVPDNTGLWPTIRQTFGDGVAALFTSVKTIGVLAAFLTPWIFTLGLLAWIARRIYVRKKR